MTEVAAGLAAQALASADVYAAGSTEAVPESAWSGAVTLAVAFVVVPIVVGYLAARWSVRPWTGARRWLAGAGVVAALTVASALAPVGFWSQVALALLAAAGVVRGALPARPRPFVHRDLPMAGALLLAFVAGELGARWLPPVPPDVADRRPLRLEFHPNPATWNDDEAKALLHGSADDPLVAARIPAASGASPTVLHLGDSMIYPFGVAREDGVVARVDRLDEARHHLNVAVSGAGPDFYYLAVERWTPRLRPTAVVIHVCLSNDIFFDNVTTWCPGDSLVHEVEGRLEARCPTPARDWTPRPDIYALIGQSPPPFPLRILAHESVLARQLCAAFTRVGRRIGAARPRGGPEWDRVEKLLAAIRDALAAWKIPLVVVIAPHRPDIEALSRGEAPAEPERNELLQRCRRLGIDVRDPTEAFAAALAGRDPGGAFGHGDDFHLNAEGHRIEAEWLVSELSF